MPLTLRFNASDPKIYPAQQLAKNDTLRQHIALMSKSFVGTVEIIETEPATSLRALVEVILRLSGSHPSPVNGFTDTSYAKPVG